MAIHPELDEYLAEMTGDRVAWGLRHVIRALRDQEDLSQEKLAERARLSTITISRIERGVVAPDIATVEKIAAAFGMDAAALLREVPGQHDGSPPPLPDDQEHWLQLWRQLHPDARRFAYGVVAQLDADAKRGSPPSLPSDGRTGHKAS